jgi:hypothetical protein
MVLAPSCGKEFWMSRHALLVTGEHVGPSMPEQLSYSVHNGQNLVNQGVVVLLTDNPIAEVDRLDFGTRGEPPETAVVLRQNVMFTAHSENLALAEVDIDDLSDTMRRCHSYCPF